MIKPLVPILVCLRRRTGRRGTGSTQSGEISLNLVVSSRPQVQILGPRPWPKSSTIRLVPDIVYNTVNHAIGLHIRKESVEELLVVRPVAVIARILDIVLVQAVGAPEVMRKQDEVSSQGAGSAIVAQS